jgi:RNA polymerase sigma-70 factor, ECF subfamily
MLDNPLESDALMNQLAQEETPAPSAIKDQMVRLFDEARVPLLRYLSAFPLALPDAEDVVQEAFLSLFLQLSRGKSYDNLGGWLFKATHNLAVKKTIRSRSDAEKTGTLFGVEELAIDPAPNPEDQLASDQKQKRLMSVVRALPEQHRLCLYLRAEGLRYREIAEILDMSLGAVAGALGRSLAHLSRAAEL